MKKLLCSAALIGSALSVKAQEPRPHPFEIGVEGLNYAPLASIASPKLQWLSGVIFRYTPQRVGLRAGLGLSQRVTGPDTNCADCLSGETTAHMLTLRVGGQYAPVPQQKWLYTFVDVAYRTTTATGEYTGGFCGCLDYTTTRTSQGAGAMAGIGTKISIIKRISLAPELYYEGFLARVTTLQVDHRIRQTATSTRRETAHTPAVRLQATVAF